MEPISLQGPRRPDRPRLPDASRRTRWRRPAGLPMVLNVHGGPLARDSWGYDPEAQWLANRGYAVPPGELPRLDRLRQGVPERRRPRVGRQDARRPDRRRRLGRRAGLRRPDKVAIYGGSYGGYAALVGATFTPDVFAAPWTSSGRRTCMTLLESIPPYWKPMLRRCHRRVGDPETDAGVPEVALAAVPGRRDQHPAADRAGRQRPARQAGRVGADRGGDQGGRASTTSTCSSPTRATASPSRRTG